MQNLFARFVLTMCPSPVVHLSYALLTLPTLLKDPYGQNNDTAGGGSQSNAKKSAPQTSALKQPFPASRTFTPSTIFHFLYRCHAPVGGDSGRLFHPRLGSKGDLLCGAEIAAPSF
jgi:hypothetical protein